MKRRAGTDDLRAALEASLSAHAGCARTVTDLRRYSSEYATSFALEELTVDLDDGTRLEVMFKDLSASALLETARATKPHFLYQPLREIEAYRRILDSGELGTATCYGAVADAGLDRYWLFLEKVPGVELYQVGDLAVWQGTARWLAGFHDHFLLDADDLTEGHPHLLHHDALARRWFERAQAFADQAGPDDRRRGVARLAAAHEQVIERLAVVPTTFVHGELYASNVLVVQGLDGLRVCPVDWEMAGMGAGLLDLAALCTGWTEAPRRDLALTYAAAIAPRPGWPPDTEEFLALLDCARIVLAMRWLGWSTGWSPPVEHARDWLGEALCAADALGL